MMKDQEEQGLCALKISELSTYVTLISINIYLIYKLREANHGELLFSGFLTHSIGKGKI
jgi:hypothetical protein